MIWSSRCHPPDPVFGRLLRIIFEAAVDGFHEHLRRPRAGVLAEPALVAERRPPLEHLLERARGFTGGDHALEGHNGFFDVFCTQANLPALIGELGSGEG